MPLSVADFLLGRLIKSAGPLNLPWRPGYVQPPKPAGPLNLPWRPGYVQPPRTVSPGWARAWAGIRGAGSATGRFLTRPNTLLGASTLGIGVGTFGLAAYMDRRNTDGRKGRTDAPRTGGLTALPGAAPPGPVDDQSKDQGRSAVDDTPTQADLDLLAGRRTPEERQRAFTAATKPYTDPVMGSVRQFLDQSRDHPTPGDFDLLGAGDDAEFWQTKTDSKITAILRALDKNKADAGRAQVNTPDADRMKDDPAALKAKADVVRGQLRSGEEGRLANKTTADAVRAGLNVSSPPTEVKTTPPPPPPGGEEKPPPKDETKPTPPSSWAPYLPGLLAGGIGLGALGLGAGLGAYSGSQRKKRKREEKWAGQHPGPEDVRPNEGSESPAGIAPPADPILDVPPGLVGHPRRQEPTRRMRSHRRGGFNVLSGVPATQGAPEAEKGAMELLFRAGVGTGCIGIEKAALWPALLANTGLGTAAGTMMGQHAAESGIYAPRQRATFERLQALYAPKPVVNKEFGSLSTRVGDAFRSGDQDAWNDVVNEPGLDPRIQYVLQRFKANRALNPFLTDDNQVDTLLQRAAHHLTYADPHAKNDEVYRSVLGKIDPQLPRRVLGNRGLVDDRTRLGRIDQQLGEFTSRESQAQAEHDKAWFGEGGIPRVDKDTTLYGGLRQAYGFANKYIASMPGSFIGYGQKGPQNDVDAVTGSYTKWLNENSDRYKRLHAQRQAIVGRMGTSGTTTSGQQESLSAAPTLKGYLHAPNNKLTDWVPIANSSTYSRLGVDLPTAPAKTTPQVSPAQKPVTPPPGQTSDKPLTGLGRGGGAMVGALKASSEYPLVKLAGFTGSDFTDAFLEEIIDRGTFSDDEIARGMAKVAMLEPLIANEFGRALKSLDRRLALAKAAAVPGAAAETAGAEAAVAGAAGRATGLPKVPGVGSSPLEPPPVPHAPEVPARPPGSGPGLNLTGGEASDVAAESAATGGIPQRPPGSATTSGAHPGEPVVPGGPVAARPSLATRFVSHPMTHVVGGAALGAAPMVYLFGGQGDEQKRQAQRGEYLAEKSQLPTDRRRVLADLSSMMGYREPGDYAETIKDWGKGESAQAYVGSADVNQGDPAQVAARASNQNRWNRLNTFLGAAYGQEDIRKHLHDTAVHDPRNPYNPHDVVVDMAETAMSSPGSKPEEFVKQVRGKLGIGQKGGGQPPPVVGGGGGGGGGAGPQTKPPAPPPLGGGDTSDTEQPTTQVSLLGQQEVRQLDPKEHAEAMGHLKNFVQQVGADPAKLANFAKDPKAFGEYQTQLKTLEGQLVDQFKANQVDKRALATSMYTLKDAWTLSGVAKQLGATGSVPTIQQLQEHLNNADPNDPKYQPMFTEMVKDPQFQAILKQAPPEDVWGKVSQIWQGLGPNGQMMAYGGAALGVAGLASMIMGGGSTMTILPLLAMLGVFGGAGFMNQAGGIQGMISKVMGLFGGGSSQGMKPQLNLGANPGVNPEGLGGGDGGEQGPGGPQPGPAVDPVTGQPVPPKPAAPGGEETPPVPAVADQAPQVSKMPDLASFYQEQKIPMKNGQPDIPANIPQPQLVAMVSRMSPALKQQASAALDEKLKYSVGYLTMSAKPEVNWEKTREIAGPNVDRRSPADVAQAKLALRLKALLSGGGQPTVA